MLLNFFQLDLHNKLMLHMMKQIYDEALVEIKPPMIMVMGSEPCLLIP